ncbi:hypothetical protein CDAR_591051 [Caerostris darwini]|uniref:Ribosomal protein L32 n=1 Tax=Caerostris darwini TaxID=1538125 RepID=A0AAV4RMT2_9ARAC|nr:hypothetical protein CDAR_591051 [Caerostris darwini]
MKKRTLKKILKLSGQEKSSVNSGADGFLIRHPTKAGFPLRVMKRGSRRTFYSFFYLFFHFLPSRAVFSNDAALDANKTSRKRHFGINARNFLSKVFAANTSKLRFTETFFG